MKYRLIHLTTNGPHDYTLRIEERLSVWSRLFSTAEPTRYEIHGSGYGDWEHRVVGIRVPDDLIEFANEVIIEHEHGLRLRK